MGVATLTQVTIIDLLVEAVANAEDKNPAELEAVLENHTSTEAILDLDDHESESWTLQFELPNHTVQVVGDGTILVYDTQTNV